MSLVIVFPSHQTSLVERNRRILARSVRPASAAVAKARFRGEGGNRPRVLHYRSKEKLLSGLCHDRTNLALMRLDDASVVCAKHRARHPRFVERLLREVTRSVRPSASSSTPICRSKPPGNGYLCSKPQDGKSWNKERTASDRQFCYCPVGFSAWLIRYGGGNAAEENNGRVSDRYRQ